MRVNPLLDDARVPVEFVKYIIFHEMLHSVVPSVFRNGKRFDHPPEYKVLEKAYPESKEMKQIARRLIHVL